MKHLAILIICFLICGCMRSPKVILFPMSPDHIFYIPKGAMVEWWGDDGDIEFVKQNGYFLSEKYLKEVMEVKVERN